MSPLCAVGRQKKKSFRKAAIANVHKYQKYLAVVKVSCW